MFPRSARNRYRLPRVNLGSRHLSLPDAAAAGGVTEVTCLTSALCSLLPSEAWGLQTIATVRQSSPLHAVGNKVPRAQEWRVLPKAPSIRNGRRFIAALQDCVVQIRR